MNKKALSLAELIVVLVLIGILLFSVYSVHLIFLFTVNHDLERYNMSTQISLAMDDMKLHFISASQMKEGSFFDSAGETKERLDFIGESDIYNITPDILTDNGDYSYYISDAGALVLEGTDGAQEVLVEAKYSPQLEFTYTQGDEPNFITVKITTTGIRKLGSIVSEVSKTAGIRFWFVDVVQ